MLVLDVARKALPTNRCGSTLPFEVFLVFDVRFDVGVAGQFEPRRFALRIARD